MLMGTFVRSVDDVLPRLGVAATALAAVSCAGPSVTKTGPRNRWVHESRDPIRYPSAKAAVADHGGTPYPFLDDPPTPAWRQRPARTPKLPNDFDVAAGTAWVSTGGEPFCPQGPNSPVHPRNIRIRGLGRYAHDYTRENISS